MKIEIYNDKKLLKSKIIRTAKRFVSIISVTAMLASAGISSSKNKEKIVVSNNEPTIIETNVDDYKSNYIASDKVVRDSNVLREIENDAEGKKLAFIDYVDNMNTTYMYEEYYGIDVVLAHNYETPHLESHSFEELLQYEELNQDIIYEIITKNNKAFKDANTEPTYYNVPDKLLKKYCKIIAEVINEALVKDPSIDRNSLLCRVGNLKIFFENDESINGKMTQDGSIVLNPNSIDYLIKNYYQNRDMYEFYFRHELEHIFHMFCEDERNPNLIKGGVGIKFKKDSQNPLFWNWFYEGSAEKCAMNQTNQEESTYFFNVAYIDSLTFSNILDPSVGKTDTEETNRTRELQAFFNKFKNIDEDELIRMMYALDLYLVNIFELEDIFNRATEKEYTREEQKLLKCQLKASVMETLSKNFYLNLINVINDQVTIEDVLYLIRSWEIDVNTHIAFNAEEYAHANKDFMEKYSQMQTYFFEYLCAFYNISMEDLENKLKDFNPRSECNITWLAEDEKQFIVELLANNDDYIANNKSGAVIKPIRVYNQILNERNKTNEDTIVK